jgi:hypothetical protein
VLDDVFAFHIFTPVADGFVQMAVEAFDDSGLSLKEDCRMELHEIDREHEITCRMVGLRPPYIPNE